MSIHDIDSTTAAEREIIAVSGIWSIALKGFLTLAIPGLLTLISLGTWTVVKIFEHDTRIALMERELSMHTTIVRSQAGRSGSTATAPVTDTNK